MCQQLSAAIKYVIIFIMHVCIGVQADIDEGKFMPKAPVISVRDTKTVKVFIVSKYI